MPCNKQSVMPPIEFQKRFDTCALILDHLPMHDFVKKDGKLYSSGKRALNGIKANTHSGARFGLSLADDVIQICVNGGWVIRDTHTVRCKQTKQVIAPVYYTQRIGFSECKFITYQYVNGKYQKLETYETYNDAVNAVTTICNQGLESESKNTETVSPEFIEGKSKLTPFEVKQKEELGNTLFELLNADLLSASKACQGETKKDADDQSLKVFSMESSLFEAQEQAISAFLENDLSLFTYPEFSSTQQKLANRLSQ